MFLTKLNEVLASKKPFISDRQNFAALGIALLINIIHWVLLLLKIGLSNNSIVLHFNVIYGTDLVDRAALIFSIPAAAFLIFVLNVVVSGYLYRREKLASYFLNATGIALQIIFLAASLTLIVINDQ
jgi:hypothetical protein